MSTDNELGQSSTVGINHDNMSNDNDLGQSPTVGISDSMSNQLGQSVSLYCFYVRTV